MQADEELITDLINIIEAIKSLIRLADRFLD